MSEEIKDFHVKITVKNNRLVRAIKAAGFKTITECALVSMVPASTICSLLLFKTSPISKRTNDWSNYAWALSSALHLEPEELWPEHIARLRSRKNSIELSMDEAEIKQLASNAPPEIDMAAYNKLLSTISPKLKNMLEGHVCDGKTFEELSVNAGEHGGKVTRERPRQMIMKAERLLKHPSRHHGLTKVADYQM